MEEKEEIVLPEKLQRGVCEPYVFGAAEYYYLVGQTQNPVLDPYKPTRLNNMLTTEDFARLRWQDYLESPHTKTVSMFRHVRLAIDPYTMGADAYGNKKTGSNDPAGDFANNRLALRDTIKEAVDENMAVILDIHPTIITQGHAQALWTGPYGKTGTCPTWPGPMKKSLVTLATPGGSVPTDHPLVVFWSWFAEEIKSWSQDSNYSSIITPEWVFLEVMNEPLVDFSAGNCDEDGNVFNGHILEYRKDWRKIQKATINAIHASNRLPSYWVIATSYTGDARDLKGWIQDVPPDTTATKWIEEPPYSYSEVTGADQVIYSVHIYHPYRYTHTSSTAYSADPEYTLSRDFLHSTTYDDPTALGYPENDGQQDGSDRSTTFMINDMESWSNGCDDFIPAMMSTEFGAKRRNFSLNNPPLEDSGPEGGGSDGKQRARYHYDVRTSLEANCMGWTVFARYGGFNIWNGALYGATFSDRWTGTPQWMPFMKEALFGDRP